MKHAVTRELFSYWEQIRNGRAAPERSDIDPAAIRGVLSDTFIAEVDRDSPVPRFPIRLAGTRTSALVMRELKGQSLIGLWAADDRPALLKLLSCVTDECAPVAAGLRSSPGNHQPLELELLVLPLRHYGRTHARILGSIAPMTVPSWLGLLPTQPFSITSLRVHRPQAGDAVWPGVGRDRLPFTAPAPPRRYGSFVVHDGGRERADRTVL